MQARAFITLYHLVFPYRLPTNRLCVSESHAPVRLCSVTGAPVIAYSPVASV